MINATSLPYFLCGKLASYSAELFLAIVVLAGMEGINSIQLEYLNIISLLKSKKDVDITALKVTHRD